MFLAGGFMGIWSRFDHVYLGMSHRKKQQIPIPEKKSGTGGCSSTTFRPHLVSVHLGTPILESIPGFWDQNSLSVGERHLLTHSPVVLAKKTSLLWWKFPLSWFIPHCSWLHTDNKWSTCNGHPRPQIHKFPSLAEIFGLGSITRFSCHTWDENRKHLGWDAGDERTKSWIIFGNYIKPNFPFMDVISMIYDGIQVSLWFMLLTFYGWFRGCQTWAHWHAHCSIEAPMTCFSRQNSRWDGKYTEAPSKHQPERPGHCSKLHWLNSKMSDSFHCEDNFRINVETVVEPHETPRETNGKSFVIRISKISKGCLTGIHRWGSLPWTLGTLVFGAMGAMWMPRSPSLFPVLVLVDSSSTESTTINVPKWAQEPWATQIWKHEPILSDSVTLGGPMMLPVPDQTGALAATRSRTAGLFNQFQAWAKERSWFTMGLWLWLLSNLMLMRMRVHPVVAQKIVCTWSTSCLKKSLPVCKSYVTQGQATLITLRWFGSVPLKVAWIVLSSSMKFLAFHLLNLSSWILLAG